MKIKSWMYPLIAGFFLLLTNSCEKENQQALLPVLNTSTVSAITQTSAISGGEITSDGGSSITARGVCWNTSFGPTTADGKTTNGTGTGSFTSEIGGLAPGTAYHIRAYATNKYGTTYGVEGLFVTSSTPVIPTISAPVLTTMAVGTISQTVAICGGLISSDMGAPVTERGVCWSTTENPTTANSKVSSGTGTGAFSCTMINLTPGTIYYVRAYAVNSSGTGYGESISFQTVSAVSAVLSTTSITGISHYLATGGGNITLSGGSLVTARGICWSTLTMSPTITDTKTIDGAGTGAFTSSLTGLLPSTTYYVRAYATNGTTTGYGEPRSFTTPAPVVPILTSAAVTAITESTAASGGSVSEDKGASVTARGVCWSTSPAPTSALTTKTSDGTGLGSFTSAITGLLGSTTYYVRAYATNTAGSGYGDEYSFTTPAPILSVVTTTAATAVTASTVSTGGNITNSGGALIIERGVCYSSTNTVPTIADTKLTGGTATGVVAASVTGLMGSTTYYLRAYSTTAVGTSYGSVISFTTSAPVIPVLAATTAATAITKISATSGGNITNGGGATVTGRGLCWNTATNPTTANSKVVVGSGSGTFTGNLTGLTANTTYYVRSYAINSAGTAYGAVISFKTLP